MSVLDDLDYDEPLKTMYKYASFKSAFNILKSNEIYFAKLSEFNDPFDGLMTPGLSTIEERKTFIENAKKTALEQGSNSTISKDLEQMVMNNQETADQLARTVADGLVKIDSHGFCCLTNTCQSLPMWAHYADNHTGCCLVFDFSTYSRQKEEKCFPFNYMKEIKYHDHLPMHNMERVWHYYGHKSREWEYEHEWRAIMYKKEILQEHYPNSFLSEKSNGSGLYPCNFLCGVILGDKMEDAYKEVIKIVARQRGIYVQQASRKLYEYGIEVL